MWLLFTRPALVRLHVLPLSLTHSFTRSHAVNFHFEQRLCDCYSVYCSVFFILSVIVIFVFFFYNLVQRLRTRFANLKKNAIIFYPPRMNIEQMMLTECRRCAHSLVDICIFYVFDRLQFRFVWRWICCITCGRRCFNSDDLPIIVWNWVSFTLSSENVTGSINVALSLSLLSCMRLIRIQNWSPKRNIAANSPMNVRLNLFLFCRWCGCCGYCHIFFYSFRSLLSRCVFWFVTLMQVTVNLLYILFSS